MVAVRRTRAPGAFLFLLGTLGLVLAALQSCLTTFTGGTLSQPVRSDAFELQAAAVKKASAAKKAPVAKKAVKKAPAKKAPAKKKAVVAKKKVVVKKVKKVPTIAKGMMARKMVWNGSRQKTTGGLTKKDLILKNGRLVSKKRSAIAKKLFAKSPIKAWSEATKKARKELKIKGFQAIGGKTAQGKKLLEKIKSLV